MSEKITFETEDGDIELYVLEQTTLFGVNYILVTDDEESEDGSFFVLKEEPDSEGDVVFLRRSRRRERIESSDQDL